MRARTANNGKVIVKGSKMLKGRGVQFRGVASNGEYSFLLTQTAYEKIQNQCTYEK